VQDQEDGPLFKFYNKIRDEGGDFMLEMTKLTDLTLFAPSNSAWDAANIDNLYNRDKLREILNLHLVRERLPVEKIRDENVHQVCVYDFLNSPIRLYLFFCMKFFDPPPIRMNLCPTLNKIWIAFRLRKNRISRFDP
jgi:hypothetical protein